MRALLPLLLIFGLLLVPVHQPGPAPAPSIEDAGPSFAPEAFSELTASRTRTSKTFQSGEILRVEASMATLHFESTPFSGVFDTEVDLAPRRINNAQLDGWVVTANGWHHALGQPGDKTTDGWVGLGPRGGQHFLEFRLAQVAYIHWPTRSLDDIGGAPTYTRANLQGSVENITIGGVNLNVSALATWTDIWSTPGGGALNISWRASGDGLKEEISINRIGRDWIRTNRPPATPTNETYLAFIFNVDWNDIPKIVRDGLEQNRDGDFDDLNGTASIELLDALDRVLAFLPVGDILVRDPASPDPLDVIDSMPLRRRFFEFGGSHFMALGARTDLMASLAPGDLIYDPTINVQVGASGDDTDTEEQQFSSTSTDPAAPGLLDNKVGDASFRFTNVNVPNSANITAASFEPRTKATGKDGVGTKSNILLEDADNPTAPTSLGDFNGRVRTTNFTAWDDQDFTTGFTTSPDISAVVQEVVDRAGWSGDAMQVFWDDDGSTNGKSYVHFTYDESPSFAAKLSITFAPPPQVETAPADPVLGFSARLHGNLTNISGFPSVDVGFDWGDTEALGNLTPTQALTANGTFSFDLTGLQTGTTFFFQAVANGVNGTTLNFTTQAAFVPPAVITDPVLSQAQTLAVLEGTVSTLGELNITEANVSFEWGLSPTALAFNTTPELVAIPGSFQATITDLDPGTTYFYRAVIQWNPEVFGEVESFTTEFSSFFERPDTVAAIILSVLAVLLCLFALMRRRDDAMSRGIAAICGVVTMLAGFVWLTALGATLFAGLIATAIVAVGLIIFIASAAGSRR